MYVKDSFVFEISSRSLGITGNSALSEQLWDDNDCPATFRGNTKISLTNKRRWTCENRSITNSQRIFVGQCMQNLKIKLLHDRIILQCG
jgi:hypothetical protein